MRKRVSIPSSGSIQFLQGPKRRWDKTPLRTKVSIPSSGSIQFLRRNRLYMNISLDGLNPLKRVNSILTLEEGKEY